MRFLTVLLLTLSLSVALVTTQHETPESKNEKEDPAIPDEDEENFRRPEEDLKEFLVPPPEVDEKMNELPPVNIENFNTVVMSFQNRYSI